MATLSTNMMILFYGTAALVFCWFFVRGKQWTELTPALLASTLKTAALVVVPFAILFGAAQLAGFTIASAILYFVPAMLIPFIVSRLNFLPFERSILLLVLSVAATTMLPSDVSAQMLPALIGGLLVWKVSDNLLLPERSTLEDILPSLIWFTTLYFTATGGVTGDATVQHAVVLGTLCTSMFLRWVQRPLLAKGDPLFLKRVVLTLTGGLTVLCIVTKVIAAAGAMPKIAAIAGIGFFLAYILQSIDENKEDASIKGLKQLIYIGIFTLVASRLFGMLGVLVLASAMMVATVSCTAHIAGAFWAIKALAQTFTAQYNPNVTGINLTHSYTSAALYAGFLAVVVLSLFIRDSKDRRTLLLLLLGGAVALPLGANYFVHPEPTAALLVAATVAGILMSIMGNALYNKVVESKETLMLLPGLMACGAVLSYELLEKGETSSTHDRLVAVGVAAALVVVAGIINHFISNKPKTSEPQPVSSQPASGS